MPNEKPTTTPKLTDHYYVGKQKPVVTHLSEPALSWQEQLALRPVGSKYGFKRDWPEGDYIATDNDMEDNGL